MNEEELEIIRVASKQNRVREGEMFGPFFGMLIDGKYRRSRHVYALLPGFPVIRQEYKSDNGDWLLYNPP